MEADIVSVSDGEMLRGVVPSDRGAVSLSLPGVFSGFIVFCGDRVSWVTVSLICIVCVSPDVSVPVSGAGEPSGFSALRTSSPEAV